MWTAMLIGLDGARAILLWWTLPTYMTLIGAAMLASGGVLLWQTRRTWRMSHTADSALLAAALGLVLARAEHVIVNWSYFSTMPDEIATIPAGGLDAHGAIFGAALGGYIVSQVFRAPYSAWLGAAAFALPIVSVAAWWGCAAANCAYGAEVGNLADYPRWLVWEAPGDYLMVAPRYAVQPLGMYASAAVLLVTLLSARLGMRGVRLAGLALLGVSLTSLVLGFLRGDPSAYTHSPVMLALDAAFAVAGLTLIVWPRRRLVPSA